MFWTFDAHMGMRWGVYAGPGEGGGKVGVIGGEQMECSVAEGAQGGTGATRA